MSDDTTDLLTVSFNQDTQCFAAGTSTGFRIYNISPFKETFRRDFPLGNGFSIVEMLFRCNIIALVGSPTNPLYPPHKFLLWDDHHSRIIAEFSFRSPIRSVKLHTNLIIIVLHHKTYIYNFNDLKLVHQIETVANPKGICAVSHSGSVCILACPGVRKGQVRIHHFGVRVTKFVTAHDANIACVCLTMDGLLMATASVKGTLVRIFNTMDGTRLQEVRRGVERADIYSIALSMDAQWLAVSSDKGTVHVFSLRVRVVGEDAANERFSAEAPELAEQNSGTSLDALISTNVGANPSSSLSFMKGVLPKYFSSEWSFAQFRLPEVTCYIAAFGSQNTVIIVGLDGSFYRCKFDPINGGEMMQQEYVRFLKTDNRTRPAT